MSDIGDFFAIIDVQMCVVPYTITVHIHVTCSMCLESGFVGFESSNLSWNVGLWKRERQLNFRSKFHLIRSTPTFHRGDFLGPSGLTHLINTLPEVISDLNYNINVSQRCLRPSTALHT